MDGIDLDQQKLFRALFGYRFMQKDLLPGTLFIHEDWDGRLSAAGRGFDDIEGLIPFLDEIPVEVLKSGICWHSCNARLACRQRSRPDSVRMRVWVGLPAITPAF